MNQSTAFFCTFISQTPKYIFIMTPLEVVQHYYSYFNTQNWTGMLSLVSDDIRHEPNQGDPRIGKDLFQEFLQKMDTAYQEELRDLTFFTSSVEGRIAVEFTVHGIYKEAEEGLPPAHGQTYVLPAAAFLEVKEKKIVRVTTYYNLPLWIQCVTV